MDEQLRKRLEEAAEKYQEEYETTERVAFTHGAVWGYKEAIEAAKEWLMNYFFFDNSLMSASGCALFLRTFETNMNKLWEEKK